MSIDKKIKVIVQSAENIIYEGEVDRISSFNEVGRFDVFPMHANFISIIQKELTLFSQNKLIKEVKIEKAIMKVKQDVANIYLGLESLAIENEMLGESQKQNNPATTKS